MFFVFGVEMVFEVCYWIDVYFSFIMICDSGFCFENGQFVMIGLEIDMCLLLCVYLIVSVNWEENLEFFSIKVQDGLLILCLQYIKLGDKVLVGKKFIGILLISDLYLGKYLYLLGIGIGLVFWLLVIKDLEIYECFDKVIFIYGVCFEKDLVYCDLFEKELCEYEFFGEMIGEKLLYYLVVICELFLNQGCLILLMESGEMQKIFGLLLLDLENDCVMICGSLQMLVDLCSVFDVCGFQMFLCIGMFGYYVFECVFVEK